MPRTRTRTHPRTATGSTLGCEVARAALRAAGDRGIALPTLIALVVDVGGCTENAAYQALLKYVWQRGGIVRQGWSRGRGYAIASQRWRVWRPQAAAA